MFHRLDAAERKLVIAALTHNWMPVTAAAMALATRLEADLMGGENDAGLQPETTADGVELRFRNHYEHCGQSWSMDWDSTCNDKCPVCNKEIEPTESEDL